MLQSYNMKYQFKYNLSISCDKLFTINQHKFLVSCFFCLVYCKTKLIANVHEKVHPLSCFIHIFIHKYNSFMTCGKIFFHITKYFVLSVKKYSLNILSTWEEYLKKDSVLLPCSCSPIDVHAHILMKQHPPNNGKEEAQKEG